MDFGVHQQLILMGLLLAVAALLVAAPALHVPYPILLVLGGLALGFIPGVPTLQLPPELVLIAFLPPLLYSAAFFTSLRELRENIRPIGTLAIGLVLATMTAVAVVAHSMVDDMSWARPSSSERWWRRPIRLRLPRSCAGWECRAAPSRLSKARAS